MSTERPPFTRESPLPSTGWAAAARRGEGGEQLARLGRILEAGDAEAAERFISAAREHLPRGADDARSGGEYPEIQAVSKRTATKE